MDKLTELMDLSLYNNQVMTRKDERKRATLLGVRVGLYRQNPLYRAFVVHFASPGGNCVDIDCDRLVPLLFVMTLAKQSGYRRCFLIPMSCIDPRKA